MTSNGKCFAEKQKPAKSIVHKLHNEILGMRTPHTENINALSFCTRRFGSMKEEADFHL